MATVVLVGTLDTKGIEKVADVHNQPVFSQNENRKSVSPRIFLDN